MLFDDREQVLGVSVSWLEASGYSRKDLSTIEDWTARAYGERKGDVLERIRWIISAEPEAQPIERTIRTKDRRDRVWSFVTSALGQSNGRRLFITVAQDGTERKVHEERAHLLMREVNHRAKNMLSLVQAIVNQTAARELPDFIERFTQRIQALAANQNLLVRNEWRGVDVDDLVHAQLSPFADLIGSRIVVGGPKLRLSASAAQEIGLVLHELATNAGKYGALSTEAGQVEIRWDAAENDTFTMSWIESDGPPVFPPYQRGFGTVVIEGVGKYNLKGKVDLHFVASGVTWRFACPAANALER
jgi:PAS domain S-box-containing protein